MKHTFTMERLTIGDMAVLLHAVKTSDMAMVIPIIDKARDGGILELPLQELEPVMAAFAKEYAAYLEGIKTAPPDNIAHLLKRALGEG